MDQRNKLKIPSELSLAAFLSGGITLVLSITYASLCITALVYRYQCDAGLASGASGSSYFIDTVYRVYIQQDACGNAEASAPAGVSLTDPETIFIFLIVILILSTFSCVAAIVLITVVAIERQARDVVAAVWVHAGLAVVALVVDTILAAFLGVDHQNLADVMNNSLPGILINYRIEVLRMGSLLLMSVALKGYVAHAVNVALVVPLAVYATRLKSPRADEHPIHKMGAINAYELQKREDAWQQQQEADLSLRRGQHSNPGFESDDEPRRGPRSPSRAMPLTPLSPMSDYSNRVYDRSDSWQHSPGSRPFSYVEEPRRAPAPAPQPQWRRDPWPPAPPVPAPDYSPPSRRLKSAMKSNYM